MKQEDLRQLERKMLGIVRTTFPEKFGDWENEEFKCVQLLFYFYTDVLNGGVLQWYGNQPGDYLEETIACLNEISCPEIGDRLLVTAQKIFGTVKSSSYEHRSKQIDKIIDNWSIRKSLTEDFDYWFEDHLQDFLTKFCHHFDGLSRQEKK